MKKPKTVGKVVYGLEVRAFFTWRIKKVTMPMPEGPVTVWAARCNLAGADTGVYGDSLAECKRNIRKAMRYLVDGLTHEPGCLVRVPAWTVSTWKDAS